MNAKWNQMLKNAEKEATEKYSKLSDEDLKLAVANAKYANEGIFKDSFVEGFLKTTKMTRSEMLKFIIGHEVKYCAMRENYKHTGIN